MEPLVVVVDNHDSFTYNLVQYLGELGARCTVVLSDRTSTAAIADLRPNGIVLSPGPGRPSDAGVTLEAIDFFARVTPLLGVCLGHQAIGQAFGARVRPAPELMHGKTSLVEHDGRGIFLNLPSPFNATRYHSLIVDGHDLPECLEVSARTLDGAVMGIRHRALPVTGIQFHPESILTEHGRPLLHNWLRSL